jgi:hypothetical protein
MSSQHHNCLISKGWRPDERNSSNGKELKGSDYWIPTKAETEIPSKSFITGVLKSLANTFYSKR